MAFGEIAPENIGMELVFGQRVNDRMEDILFSKPLGIGEVHDGIATFSSEFGIDHAGVLDYAIRMYPANPLIAHKQETGMVKWI